MSLLFTSVSDFIGEINLDLSSDSNTSDSFVSLARQIEDDILLDLLRRYELINNKHIPDEYLHNSRKNRLELLAGLIDTDGYKDKMCYEITQKTKILADQIVYLARSLGFKATVSEKISAIKN